MGVTPAKCAAARSMQDDRHQKVTTTGAWQERAANICFALEIVDTLSLGRGGVMATSNGKNPAQRRYPPEIKERAVRMVFQLRREDPADQSVLARVARQLDVGLE